MTIRRDSHGTADAQQQSVQNGLRARAREAVAHQPTRTVTVLSSLLAAQDGIGYLPTEAIDEIAQRTGASLNEVWGVASFYPNFRFTPPARHKVELCWGPTCHVLGAQPILQGLLRHLGLENEGDTADGAVTLKLNTCLGVCPHGPAMSFDDEVAGHVSLERAVRQVALLRVEDEEQQHARQMEEEAERTRAERQARAASLEGERRAAARAAARAEEQAALEAAEAPETEDAGDEAAAASAEPADDAAATESVGANDEEAPAEEVPAEEVPAEEVPAEEEGPPSNTSAQASSSSQESGAQESGSGQRSE